MQLSSARTGPAIGGATPTAAWRPLLAEWAAARVAAERGRFALFLPLLMAAGAAWYLLLPAEPPSWIGAAGLAVGAALTAWRRHAVARTCGVVMLAVALGFAAGQAATWRAAPLLEVPRKAVVVTGRVLAVEVLPQGRRVTVGASAFTGADGTTAPAARRVRIRLRNEDAVPVAAGDRLSVRALLTAPSPPSYPGAWDLQRDDFFAGVGAYGFALGRASVTPLPPSRGLSALMQTLRETIVARIDAVLSGADAAIAMTLLTGDPSAVDAADRAAFRDSGLAHLLAIAGLHIGIVMGLTFAAVRLLLAAWERAALHWPIKAAAAVAALLAGGGYMLLTGAHVPIVRSFAMGCLFTLAVLAGRRAVSLRGWALAMAALVLLSPDAVLGVSFQMSFSAVLALIAGWDALRPALTRLRGEGGFWRGAAGVLLGLALTSALAGGASAPFAAYHFGRIQIYFVLANLVAVPVTAFWVMPAGLLALLLMPLHLQVVALLPMAWGEDALLWIAHTVSSWPGATWAVPPMPPWGLVATAAGLAWLGLWRTRLRLAGLPVLLLGLLSPIAARPPDILVSADARLIGLHTRQGVFVQPMRGAQKFEQAAWESYWADGPAHTLPADGQVDDVACAAAACRWQTPAGLVLLARDADAAGVCDAALVLSAAPLRRRCPPTTVVIDRFSVWREGAYAAWVGAGGLRVLSEHTLRGDRPWVPSPWHRGSVGGLPLAPVEKLPPE